jgi:hypothetical protein
MILRSSALLLLTPTDNFFFLPGAPSANDPLDARLASIEADNYNLSRALVSLADKVAILEQNQEEIIRTLFSIRRDELKIINFMATTQRLNHGIIQRILRNLQRILDEIRADRARRVCRVHGRVTYAMGTDAPSDCAAMGSPDAQPRTARNEHQGLFIDLGRHLRLTVNDAPAQRDHYED